MNKHVKRLLIVLIIIAVIVLCAAGFVKFMLNKADNSEDVQNYKTQLEQETETNTDTLLSMIDAATNEAVQEAADNTANNGTNTSDGNGQNGQPAQTDGENGQVTDGGSGTGGATGSGAENSSLKSSLKSKYHSIMLSQQGAALSKLNGLVAEAKGEYSSLKASGAGAGAMGDLAARYYAKAAALEGSMDSSFEAGLSKMAADFQKNGIDPSDVISQFRSEYEGIKSKYRSYYISLAKSAAS